MPTPLIELEAVTKRFPGVTALDDVSVTVEAASVHGLVGENGSGKSTLVRILAGEHQPDLGAVRVDGQIVSFHRPADALSHGIALVAQEVAINPHVSVGENVLSGRLPRRHGRILWREVRRQSAVQLDRLGLSVNPSTPAGRLPLHEQQLVSIAQMMFREPRLLILDEPTSSLGERETELLLDRLRDLRAAGGAVIFVSHRLREYAEICDRLTILRDGKLVSTLAAGAVEEEVLIRSMVGRDLGSVFARRPRPTSRQRRGPAVTVKNLTSTRLRGVTFELFSGKVLGIAGQAGSGRTALARTLFGLHPYAGEIAIGGVTVPLRSPRAAMVAGIALAPEDRKASGLALNLSVGENICLPDWRALAGPAGIRRRTVERARAEKAISDLRIKAAGAAAPVRTLSGGNQQKVVLAKWLSRDPRVLILDEPTRGIDVAAKAELYDLVEARVANGLAVLLISSELPELLRLSDRILVMVKGRSVGELDGQTATEEAIISLAFNDDRAATAA